MKTFTLYKFRESNSHSAIQSVGAMCDNLGIFREINFQIMQMISMYLILIAR